MSRKPSLLAATIAKNDTPATPAPVEVQEAAAEAIADQTSKRQPVRRRGEVPPSRRPGYVPPSRRDKRSRTFMLSMDYWDTLAELSFRSRDENGTRISQERFIAEALNDLFAKHNFPQVREE